MFVAMIYESLKFFCFILDIPRFSLLMGRTNFELFYFNILFMSEYF